MADHRNHRIQVFSTLALTPKATSSTPMPVRILGGGPSAVAGKFNGPSGLCVASWHPFSWGSLPKASLTLHIRPLGLLLALLVPVFDLALALRPRKVTPLVKRGGTSHLRHCTG